MAETGVVHRVRDDVWPFHPETRFGSSESLF
jgi:hypothetical protein